MPRTSIDRFEQRKLTRAKLIDAALKLFSTSGYEHATVDDISQAAGYSKGAYYFHFSTKDDILVELLRIWIEGRSEALAAADTDAATPESVTAMLEAFFSYAETPQWPAVLLEFWSQAVRNKQISEKLTQAYGGWRAQLGEVFARAAAAGGMHIESPQDAASVALAAHDGYAVQLAIDLPGARRMSAAELAHSIADPLASDASGEERRAAFR